MNDIEKTRRFLASPMLRKVLPIFIVLLYAVGMVLMIFTRFDLGVLLWFFSTAGGVLLLYAKRKQEKKLMDLEQEAADEADDQAQVRAGEEQD